MSLSDLIAEFLGISPQRGDEWTILCPSPEHTDHRPSASIYVGEPQERLRGGKKVMRLPGMWTCYSCHASGRVTTKGIENYEPSADRHLQVALDQLSVVEREPYPEAWLDLYEYPGGVHPYWLERFSEATACKHRLGYDYERNAGTYPLRTPDGAVLGVVRRSFDPDTRIKYRYPSGIDIHAGGFLYGYHWAIAQDADVVVVGEGALDAVACDEAGYAGLAIYGSRMSQAQVHLINRLYPTTIIFAFDNDEAGRRALEHAIHPDTGLVCPDLRQIDLGTFKDIAEVPVDQRAEILAGSAPCATLHTWL